MDKSTIKEYLPLTANIGGFLALFGGYNSLSTAGLVNTTSTNVFLISTISGVALYSISKIADKIISPEQSNNTKNNARTTVLSSESNKGPFPLQK